MTKFDLQSLPQIKKNLPVFAKITESSSQLDWLDSYLSLYKLPNPSSELSLYCGTIALNQQSIFAAAWAPKKSAGTAIIVHGYLDNLGLYGHLIENLLAQNLTVVCFDLPGHGLSNGERAFIADFSDYTQVLDAILMVCTEQFTAPFHGLGQSTGGAILLKHLFDSNQAIDYPFKSLNLLAPLLHPKGWWFNRHLIPLIRLFRKSLIRRFGHNSQDAEFSAFIRQRDILQPQVMPLPWFVAADKWARQFEASSGNDFSVNIIQGDGDKTLDWKYNLKMFGHKLPNMKLRTIKDANHHMANEIQGLRDEVFNAIDLSS
jgi:alpha-beta hydrolase superfamily lysophospholipase